MQNPISGHVFYRSPSKQYPVAVRSEGIYIYDDKGKAYLDGSSGALVSNIGHGVPEIVQAMTHQAETLVFSHGSMFTSHAQEGFARDLALLSPGDASRVYFLSGGSEATETAIKMARQYHFERGKVNKHKVIARWTSYHGSTLGALSMTGAVSNRWIYDPYLLDFPHIPPAFCYRCPFNLTYPKCNMKCAYSLEEAILKAGPENVSAFIFEPVIGSSAAGVTAPDEYYHLVKEICEKYDVLLIADEVMCGSGRTGKYFAVDHWGIVPDLIVAGKGLGCGYIPLGAVVAQKEIFDTIREGSGHFVHGHTYQGNPLACRVGLTILNFLGEHELVEKAAVKGQYLLDKLVGLAEKHPIVGDVRGKGLMLGMEFVRDISTREPFPADERISARVAGAAFENGLLVYPMSGCVDGVRGDNILVAPPLVIENAEIDLLVQKLDGSLGQVEKALA